MNNLREMLDEFTKKYVYIQVDGHLGLVRGDNELIYKILSEMMNRIETIERQNNRVEIVNQIEN